MGTVLWCQGLKVPGRPTGLSSRLSQSDRRFKTEVAEGSTTTIYKNVLHNNSVSSQQKTLFAEDPAPVGASHVPCFKRTSCKRRCMATLAPLLRASFLSFQKCCKITSCNPQPLKLGGEKGSPLSASVRSDSGVLEIRPAPLGG